MPKNNGKHIGRRSIRTWFRIAAFSCFLMMFLFSSAMAVKNVIENNKAQSDYSALRTLVRQKEYENVATAIGNEDISSSTEDISTGKKEPELNTAKETETEIMEESIRIVQQQKNSMDFSTLKEINPDIIAWIYADGTNIDYPIAQTDNNDYYLHFLFNKEWNSSGTIFADYRNSADFSDRNTVIYGHHMKNGTMFEALEEYKDQEFYNVNPTMMLFTPTGDYTIELICGTIEDGSYQFVKFDFDTDESFFQYIEGFRSRSTFVSDVELHPGDRIVSLCTCSYEWENARYMVIGRLVPVMEELKIGG